ncbi:hypothetical protein [Bacillus massiliigorillae]|nr:hypothetical protein [Bacillus massiliigorillae]
MALTNRQVKNIIWHIENNREICGEKSTLDDVLTSLKRNVKETKE